MDDFKNILDSLIDSKTIIRKVSREGESFYVNDSYDAAECSVNNDEEEGSHFNFNNISEAEPVG